MAAAAKRTEPTLKLIELRPERTEKGLWRGKETTFRRGPSYRLTFERPGPSGTATYVVDVNQFGHGRQKNHKTIEMLIRNGRTAIRRLLAN